MDPATEHDYRAATAKLLADRVRAGFWLSVVGMALFCIADGELPDTRVERVVHALELSAAAAASLFVRRAKRLESAVAATFAMLVVLCVATAAMCPVHLDAATVVLLLIVVVMGAGTLIPWGAGVQSALVLVAGLAAAMAVTYGGAPVPHGRPVVAAGLAFGVSVVVAAVLDAERRERWRAQQAFAHSQDRLAAEAAVSGTLARVTRDMISLLESPAILRRLGTATIETLAADCSHTFLWSRREQAFAVMAGCGVPEEHVQASEGLRLPREALEPVLEEVRRAGSGVTTLVAPLPDAVGCPARHTVAMGLAWGGELVGVHTAGSAVGAPAMTEAQRRFARGLAQTVSQALQKARLIEELQATSSRKTEFVSTMSHELRTPINVLLGFLEMLEDPSVDAAERRELGARLRASGRDLLELVDTMLELGRIESGRDQPRRETVRLRSFWEQLGQTCRRLPRAPEVTFAWPADVPDVEIVTDPRKLTIVVRNLVGNALKFTEKGFVAASARLEDGELVVEVRDTGIGIRPEDQRLVFEMFRQAADGTRRQGSGLGLHIVRTFVTQLGGTVRLESEYGVGSRFVVRVPADGAATARAA